MNIPEYFYGNLTQILNTEMNAAILNVAVAERKSRWAVIYGLVPYKDGNQWCVLLGDNLQEGIVAFGNTPEEAIANFDTAMREA